MLVDPSLHFFTLEPPESVTPDKVKEMLSHNLTFEALALTLPPESDPLSLQVTGQSSQSPVIEYGGQLHPHPAMVSPESGSLTIKEPSAITWPLAMISNLPVSWLKLKK